MTRAWILIFAAACNVESVSATVQPAIAANAIAANAVTTNAIAANAIAANAIAANAIAANGIPQIADPTIQVALEDPNARIFMRYLVGCALAPSQQVTWTGHTGYTETWTGLLGLCPKWHKGVPDLACRERVSACILARNNAFGVSVAFSMRGQSGVGANPLALGDYVPAHDHVPRTNREVPSLGRCRRSVDGELRDCGWQRAAVGICEPGSIVSIGAGNYASCDWEYLGSPGSTDEVLRVCPGISACDARFAIASVDNACDMVEPGIDFTCPSEGHYAVMIGTFDMYGHPDGEVGATCSAGAASCPYPASEDQVFRWREGSFYGDLFAGLNPAKPQVRVNPNANFQVETFIGNDVFQGTAVSEAFVGVVFKQMYACASSNWKNGPAYIARRVCAGPDPKDPKMYTRNCAATYAGKCQDVCETLDAGPVAGDYDAANCKGKRYWATPMTTLLADPRDAVTDPSVNATISSLPILTW